jgi:hypothetical protein
MACKLQEEMQEEMEGHGTWAVPQVMALHTAMLPRRAPSAGRSVISSTSSGLPTLVMVDSSRLKGWLTLLLSAAIAAGWRWSGSAAISPDGRQLTAKLTAPIRDMLRKKYPPLLLRLPAASGEVMMG